MIRQGAGGRIVRVAHAEQNLELGILDECVGADGFVEIRVEASNRLEDGNRRPQSPAGIGPQNLPQGDSQGQQLVSGGRRAERQKKEDHSASSATPQATRPAPAQRRHATRSLR